MIRGLNLKLYFLILLSAGHLYGGQATWSGSSEHGVIGDIQVRTFPGATSSTEYVEVSGWMRFDNGTPIVYDLFVSPNPDIGSAFYTKFQDGESGEAHVGAGDTLLILRAGSTVGSASSTR